MREPKSELRRGVYNMLEELTVLHDYDSLVSQIGYRAAQFNTLLAQAWEIYPELQTIRALREDDAIMRLRTHLSVLKAHLDDEALAWQRIRGPRARCSVCGHRIASGESRIRQGISHTHVACAQQQPGA